MDIHTTEENIQSLERMRHAFKEAAAAKTGEAQKEFIRMRDTFNKIMADNLPKAEDGVAVINSTRIFRELRALAEPLGVVVAIDKEGLNPAASATLKKLNEQLSSEFDYLNGPAPAPKPHSIFS